MPVDTTKIRTVVIVGNASAGKTSLVDALLVLTKAAAARGVADNLPEEIERKITIQAKPFWFQANDCAVTLLDTPGFADFLGQTAAAIRAADAAIVVVDALNGIEVSTRRLWKWLDEQQMPRAIFVTKLDKEGASFAKTVEQIQNVFGKNCVPFSVPVGKEASFSKTVNLLTCADADVPAEFAGAKDALQEAAAADDETLIEKYFGGEKLTAQEIGRSVAKGAVVPILCGWPEKDIGVADALNAITGLLPAPSQRGPATTEDGTKVAPDPAAPFSGQVFKVIVDPYAGALAYLRVISGTLKADMDVINATRGGKERIPQLLRIVGKNQTIVADAGPGEIVALAKLKDTQINDTLCDPTRPLKFPPIKFPKPIAFMAVHPQTQKDEEKISVAVQRTQMEDKTFHAERNPNTKELVIAGMGDTHLAVIVDGWKRKIGVNVDLTTPKVDYKETITARAEGHYKHKKQSGGRGQYGEAYLRLAPMERGAGFQFVDEVVGGAIPRNFIPAVEKGCVEAMLAGTVAGYPVVDVQATVYDGSYHDVDSNELSFKIAGLQAFKDAMQKARPVLLEPVMNVTVWIPDQYMGDITGDLNHRRGRIMGVEPADGLQCIKAQVPQAEMFKYSSELRSMTGGRGTFEMEFSHYETVPAHIAQKVVAEAQAARKAEQEG